MFCRRLQVLPSLKARKTVLLPKSAMKTKRVSLTCGLYLSGQSCCFAWSPLLPLAQRTCSYSTSTTLRSSKVLHHDELSEAIKGAWQSRETDGILQLGSELALEEYDLEDLVYASINAVPTKGQAAGILNAWIGSCIGRTDDLELGAELAWQLLDVYDSLDDLQPDMVTLSLVYTALTHRDLASTYHQLGNAALERAKKMSKKQGGSKRRRSLAASARKKQADSESVRSELQELHGIEILYESDGELVVNKPSGMACFHKHTTTSGKLTSSRRKQQRKGSASSSSSEEPAFIDISLEAALLDASVPLSSLNVDSRGMVHRIDRGTSGCIILAKTDERHAELVSKFFLREVNKDYQALVEASPEQGVPDAGTIDLPVHGRPALSLYQVEERSSDGKARLRINTKTGRKHQVRVHCANGLRAPIVGDNKYALAVDTESRQPKNKEKETFCLHASALQVPGLPEIQAPLPIWWLKSENVEA